MLLIGDDTNFSGLGLGVILPVDDLSVYARLGEGDPGSLKNYAYSGQDLTKAGLNPGLLVFTDTYVETRSGGNRYLETGIAETGSWTLMVVGAQPDPAATGEDRGFYIGNYGSAAGVRSGVGLIATNAGAQLVLANGANAALIRTAAATNTGNPHFYAATLGDGTVSVYNVTEDTSNIGADSRTTPTLNPTTFRVGSSGSGSLYYGLSRQYFAAIAPRALSKAEIDGVYEQVKEYLLPKGVSI